MRGIAIYTGLRVALLAAVWLLIQVVTPIRGLLAIAIAVVISGVISFIALDRSRDRASIGLAGAFSRINDRIERSRTAEDWDEPIESGQSDAQPEQQAVGQHEQAGPLEDGDQGSPHIATSDGSQRSDGEDDPEQGDPSEGQAQSRG
ncbi:MAG: hypothetical protein RLZZ228_1713 [Actinomycetota bacterium]